MNPGDFEACFPSAGGVVAVALLLVHLSAAMGSFDFTVKHLLEGMASASATLTGAEESGWSLGLWFQARVQFLKDNFTWPGTAMALVSLAWLFRARKQLPAGILGLLAALVLQGVLSVVLFPNRSINHPYFWLQFAPPAALGVGLACDLVSRSLLLRGHRWLLLGGVILVLVQIGHQALAGHKQRTGHPAPVQQTMAVTAKELFTDDVILVSPESAIIESILFSPHRWTPLAGVPHLKLLIARMRRGKLATTGVVLVATKPYLSTYFPDWGRDIDTLARAESAVFLGNDDLTAWVFR